MHPPHVKEEVLRLVAAGVNDCEISRRTGIPRGTIRDWRRPTYIRRAKQEPCSRCWRPGRRLRFTDGDYAELLAMYLGDGFISRQGRTWRLRITLDSMFPGILEQTKSLLIRCFPDNAVNLVPRRNDRAVDVSIYCGHLPCVLPQHGPGKKHERQIALERWQRAIIDRAPWQFIRGCIRTDGCVFINRTDIHREQPYEYLSYAFANMSQEIVHMFSEACELVGVSARITRSTRGCWQVRINRRASVARMLQHVGAKE